MRPEATPVSWPATADILERRPAQPGKSVQWTDLSRERRELERAADDASTSFAGLAAFRSSLCCFMPNWMARTKFTLRPRSAQTGVAGHDKLGSGST